MESVVASISRELDDLTIYSFLHLSCSPSVLETMTVRSLTVHDISPLPNKVMVVELVDLLWAV